MGVYIKGIDMPTSCYDCPCNKDDGFGFFTCGVTKSECNFTSLPSDCPLIHIPDYRGLFDVGQFEKGCFYGYGRDGKVYKLFWDERVFEGAKKFYINPIIPAGKENNNG